MKKRRRIAFVGLLVAVLTVAAWLTLRPREPVYQGKKLSEWTEELVGFGLGAQTDEAITAVQHIGTNAIPFLLADLQSKRLAEGTQPTLRFRARQALIRLKRETRDGGIVRGPKDLKAIALVFTGHEHAEGAETILDELAKRRAKASFFLTGDFLANANRDPVIRRIIKDELLLGPHSDKHLLYCSWETEPKTLLTREEFRRDVGKNLDKIQRAVASEHPLSDSDYSPEQKKFFGRYGITSLVEHQVRYFLPAYEHYNRQIADWTTEMELTLINFTPGTRSNADYTGEADKNFVSSQAILDSIVQKEREDPHGLNGFILLLHLGSGPGRKDKFHYRFDELLDYLTAQGYQFVRLDELLEPKETK